MMQHLNDAVTIAFLTITGGIVVWLAAAHATQPWRRARRPAAPPPPPAGGQRPKTGPPPTQPGPPPPAPDPYPAADERIEALADATRQPAALPPADQPTPGSSILLPDEARLLAQITRSCAAIPHTPAVTSEGTRIADFLRTRLPDAADAELGRAVIAMLWVSKSVAERSDDLVSAYGVLIESLSYAALHLTELERSDAP